jgi:hypothetical protein
VDRRPAPSLHQPQRRASGGASTRAAETLSRARAGLQLALPDLGQLVLAETVYLLREGRTTIGLLFARDRLARSCLLTLNLEVPNGDLAWQATVAGVTRDGQRSRDGVGASFLFDSHPPRETPE